MIILAFESSCDETAVAVVQDGSKILSSVVASQIDEHKLYGGVVPEIASRRHLENISVLTKQALEQAEISLEKIDAIAVTYAPGLIGALLVGLNFAKGISLSTKKPLIKVHHIKAHIAANYIQNPDLKPPYICLVASGGHSHIIKVKSFTEFKVLGRTIDDAAGEAYDKVARVLGFDYPGGIHIDTAAQKGNSEKYKLPIPKAQGEFNFSFSGLKTAVINLVHNLNQKNEEYSKNDVAACFQKTICSILVEKLLSATKKSGYNKIAIAGGVAANSELRKQLELIGNQNNFEIYFPSKALCADNAAMIGVQAYFEYKANRIADFDLNAIASLPIDCEQG